MINLQRNETTKKGTENREGLKDMRLWTLRAPQWITIILCYTVFYFYLFIIYISNNLRETTKISCNFCFCWDVDYTN
jgi:hypothetical protein